MPGFEYLSVYLLIKSTGYGSHCAWNDADSKWFLQSRKYKMENNMLYSVKLVDVDDEVIQLKKYYYPLANAKFIKFADILKIEKRKPTLSNGKWRYWGSGNLMTWFPLDWSRSSRDAIFFIRPATQRTVIGFTVEDTEAFVEAIESKGISVEDQD